MTNNFDAEAAKRILYEDNINVTEPNHLKDLVQILLNLILIIFCIYLLIYTLSGAVLMSLSPEKQVMVENFISPKLNTEVVNISKEEQSRINKVKQ